MLERNFEHALTFVQCIKISLIFLMAYFVDFVTLNDDNLCLKIEFNTFKSLTFEIN
jgi:hypothetical protein